jgi:hypothetical protein
MLSAIKIDKYRYIDNTKYYGNLQFFMRWFGKKNVYFCKSEDLFENPDYIMNNVYDFLGLEPISHNKE